MYDLIERSCLFVINTLYHQTIFCIILFIFIYGLSFLLKEKSPHWQLGLWFLILIRLILPTDLSLTYSARNLLDDFLIPDSFHSPLENVSEKLGVNRQPDQVSVLNVSGSLDAINNNGAPASWEHDKVKNISPSLPVILSIIWVLGCLVFLSLFLYKIHSIKRVLNHSSLVQNKEITAFVDYWRQSFNITRSVAVLSSDKYLSPFTVGVFRPIIFIPEQLLEDMDRETINSIIAHEMVHIKRFDHVWIRIQNVLQIVYFFNPVVWYANRQLNIARERLCDSEVLARQVIPPKTFGKSVIEVLAFNLTGYRLIDPFLCFSNHKKIFEYRIRDILKEKSMSKQKSLYIFLMVCLLGLFLLPMSSAQMDENISEAPDESLSFIPEKSPTSIESDRDVAEVQDNVIILGELNNRIEENSNQKNEEIRVRDEQYYIDTSDRVFDLPIDEGVDQKQEVEVKYSKASTKSIKNHEKPLKLASNKKMAGSPENKIPKLDETESENVETAEADQQRQDSTLDYTSQGVSCLEKGHFEDAVSEFNKAIDLDPDNAVAYVARGSAYFKLDRLDNAISDYNFDKAISDFSKAIELNPDDVYAYINRGFVYNSRGEYKKATSDLSRAIKLNPEYALGCYIQATYYYKRSQIHKAVSDFSKAIELYPDDAYAYINRGVFYHSIGNYRKAISDYKKAIRINSDAAAAKKLQRYAGFDMQRIQRDEIIQRMNKMYNDRKAEELRNYEAQRSATEWQAEHNSLPLYNIR